MGNWSLSNPQQFGTALCMARNRTTSLPTESPVWGRESLWGLGTQAMQSHPEGLRHPMGYRGCCGSLSLVGSGG